VVDSRPPIAAKVQECFRQCMDSPAPLASLSSFLDKLRHDRWREEDIRQVEGIVVRMLASLTSDDHEIDEG
jgi:hypothetical protein